MLSTTPKRMKSNKRQVETRDKCIQPKADPQNQTTPACSMNYRLCIVWILKDNLNFFLHTAFGKRVSYVTLLAVALWEALFEISKVFVIILWKCRDVRRPLDFHTIPDICRFLNFCGFRYRKRYVDINRFSSEALTSCSTSSTVWFGTMRMENFPITLRGITVFVPGS